MTSTRSSSVDNRHTYKHQHQQYHTASMLSCFGFGNDDDDQRPLLPQYRDDTVLQVPTQRAAAIDHHLTYQ
jgi:hypothetical protein